MSDPVARIVADADVLAADLLVGGTVRDALDIVRSHSWVSLVASEALLSDAEAVIAELGDDVLVTEWRGRIDELAEIVDHPEGDHPALATAYRGDARHVLSFDEGLRSAGAGMAIRRGVGVETSVKHPEAFALLFDPERMYGVAVGGEYPGPDRDPRG